MAFVIWIFCKQASATSTHLPQGKMAATPQTISSDVFSWMKDFGILIKDSLKFVPNGLIDNNPALV